jgi:hypothetical protein
MRSGVLVGRIYPLVDIEAGFVIFNLKNVRACAPFRQCMQSL